MAAPSEIPLVLLRRPFTLAEARALGVSRKVLRGRRFRAVHRGVYVSASLTDTVAVRAEAARLVLPDTAVLSHHTAAELRHLPVPSDGLVHATVPVGIWRPRINGISIHEGTFDDAVVFLAGRPVTSPERNFVELAGHLGLVDLVVLGDSLVRHGWTTVSALRAAASRAPWRRTAGHAQHAAGLVMARVDSPMETRSRLLLVLAGLPCPEPGRKVYDDDGQWVATLDLQYADLRIALEYDGDLHRRSTRKWRSDVSTRERLRDLGWIVIVATADDIDARPEEFLARVCRAMDSRGSPHGSRPLDNQWRDHFKIRRPWPEWRPQGHGAA